MKIKVMAIFCNKFGNEIYKKDVSDRIKELTGSLNSFLEIRDTRPCEYEDLEDQVCEEIVNDINYELQLDGEEIDSSYLEVIY